MAEENTPNPNLSLNPNLQDKLTDEEIKEIIERVEKEGTEESKYFLKLQLFTNKCHPSGIIYRESYKVVEGEVKEILIHEYEDSCTKSEELVLIPETKTVIAVEYDGFDNVTAVHVFSFTYGWRSLYL